MKYEKAIMREYKNINNGGRERVYRRSDGSYYINSDWGDGFSIDLTKVSKSEMEGCLRFTNAPQDVIDAMLG